MDQFHTLLNKYREQRSISSNALASAAHLSASYVSLLLRGNKASPSVQTVGALADALSLTDQETKELFTAAGHEISTSLPRNGSMRIIAGGRTNRNIGAEEFGLEPVLAGIVAVQPELSITLLEAAMLEARECICIQDSWLNDPRRYRKIFLEAAKRRKDIVIKVLLLNYENKPEFAAQRSLDLNQRTDKFVSERIDDALYEFGIVSKEGVNIEVRLYESLPSIQQIACDQHRFIGFFTHGERSDLSPQLEIEGDNTLLGSFFEDEFRKVWEDPTTVRRIFRVSEDIS